MNKLKNILEQVKLWQLMLAFVVSLPISAWLLRQNNLEMIELREAVILADEATGDIEQVEPALIDLQNYVTSHMNTDLGQPLELPGVYNRAVKQIQNNLKSDTVKRAYRQAELQCSRPSIPISNQAQCIQDYVISRGGPAAQSLVFPPKERFSYSFISPRWSLDLAGLSVLISALLGLAIIGQLLLEFAAPRIARSLTDDDLR